MENQKPRRVIRIKLHKKILILVGVIVLFLVGSITISNLFFHPYNLKNSVVAVPALPMQETQSNVAYPYYPNPTPQSDITDTREFLKTSYSAYLKTRNAPTVLKNVKNAIKVADGRIESLNSGTSGGYITFVIPKANFDDFRDEIEQMTYTKLYTETISSENLLNQKQGIETEMESAKEKLAERKKIQAEFAEFSKTYFRFVAEKTAQLKQVNTDKLDAKERLLSETDEAVVFSLEKKIDALTEQAKQLEQVIADQKAGHDKQEKEIADSVQKAKDAIAAIEKQDIAFGNNIETINGNISVQQVSLWRVAVLLSPIHPILIILILITGLLFFLNKKGYVPKIEFV